MNRSITRRIAAFLLFVLVGARCDINVDLAAAVNQLVPKIDNVIDAINQNSSAWQNQLESLVRDAKDLETKVAADAQNTIRLATNGLDTTLQNAIGATGAEVRCNADIVKVQVAQSLKHWKSILLRSIGSTVPEESPSVPVVCNSTPDSLHMEPALRESSAVFWGYDLQNPDLKVRLRYGNNLETDFPLSLVNAASNYKLVLITSAGDNTLVCNKDNRSIILKWKDQIISTLGVNTAACRNPAAPPALSERVHATQQLNFIKVPPFVDQTSPMTIGAACNPGYMQSRLESVTLSNSTLGASCSAQWISSDTKNCQVKVSPIFPSGSQVINTVNCQLTIYEIGIPQPAPEPCACW